MRRSFLKPTTAVANASAVGSKCQKCLQTGHWTADCTNERVYKARPSRTALLFNPKLKLPEETLVKDDFREPERPEKSERNKEVVIENEEIDADEFAEQLIAEAKQNVERESRRERDSEREVRRSPRRVDLERDSRRDLERDTRRDLESRHSRHSPRRSPRRDRHRSRSPHERTSHRSPPPRRHRSRSRSPAPIPKRDSPKEIYHYASDSDFSSDSNE